MKVLGGTAWFVSYLCAWFAFIYFGWHWATEIDSGKAMAFWLSVTSVFGIIGVWLVRSIRENGGN